MIKSLENILHERRPVAMRQWDKWDYRVVGPVSLDDSAVVRVELLNQDGTKQSIFLPLSGNEP